MTKQLKKINKGNLKNLKQSLYSIEKDVTNPKEMVKEGIKES